MHLFLLLAPVLFAAAQRSVSVCFFCLLLFFSFPLPFLIPLYSHIPLSRLLWQSTLHPLRLAQAHKPCPVQTNICKYHRKINTFTLTHFSSHNTHSVCSTGVCFHPQLSSHKTNLSQLWMCFHHQLDLEKKKRTRCA